MAAYCCAVETAKSGRKYQVDDIDAKNGETWLGLFEENDKYILRDTRLKIRTVRIDMKDEYDGGTGLRRNVGVAGNRTPVFLIEKSSRIREGSVQTIFKGTDYLEAMTDSPDNYAEKITWLSDGFVRDFNLGKNRYSLKVEKALDTNGNKTLVLSVYNGKIRQILHTTRTEGIGEDGTWLGSTGRLYWAGDIDRDGKLDLYLSLFTKDIMYDAFLFISSKAKGGFISGKAKGGEIVGKAASFHLTAGC